MRKLKYLLRRLAGIDVKRLLATVKKTARAAGKPRLFVAFDMIMCAVKYLAAPADYALFEFYRLTGAQRRTYVTRGVNDRLVKKYNRREYRHIFENKDEFNERFSAYIGRDWLRVDAAAFERFEEFIVKYPVFFYKPLSLSCGWGIEKLDINNHSDYRVLFDNLATRGPGLVEQPILQHPDMDRLNAGSVNTIRLVTINDGREVGIVFSFLRIGNGRVVDNLNSGGMAAPVDVATGRVTHPAADKDHLAYVTHPATGAPIVGFEVPMFKQAAELVREAALEVPEIGYTGWDVAVTPAGPVFVEGNSYPGHDILQLPPHVPDGIGLMGNIKRFLF